VGGRVEKGAASRTGPSPRRRRHARRPRAILENAVLALPGSSRNWRYRVANVRIRSWFVWGTHDYFFSPYKIFFRKIRFGPRTRWAGFWTRVGPQDPRGGVVEPRQAAATPAGASEGARGRLQGRVSKNRRNRRVSCRPFKGVDFRGGHTGGGIWASAAPG